jgi:hypothetical protein
MKICEQDKKHTFASYDPKERICEISGERDLWREVLFVAIEISKMDIDATLKRYKNEDNKRWERVILSRERDQARRFIMTEHDHFDQICEWLEMHPQNIREAIMEQWQ